MRYLKTIAPGIGLTFALAFIAMALGFWFPTIGGAAFAISLGLLLNNTVGKPFRSIPGVLFVSKKILQWAIIAMGCGLSLQQVWITGTNSLDVIVITLLSALLAAYVFGGMLRIPFNLKILLGVGTGICGGSAIAATAPVIEADESEIAYAISTIFLFNIIAVFLFPFLGHILGLSDMGFGLWAGTAINDTSSVVGAGYAFSSTAGDYATIVKLTRTAFIIPITFFLAILYQLKSRQESAQETAAHMGTIFPWFIIWFLLAAALNTLGVFNAQAVNGLESFGKFFIMMALGAIGLTANFRKMLKTGIKPIILGLIIWIVVALTSLLVQRMSGQW